jgi:excisionase family DNA binding protein
MKNWSIPDYLTDKPFISPNELKDILGLSLPTVYRLIDTRKLPAFKIGHQLRFSREDVLEYLKANRIDQLT